MPSITFRQWLQNRWEEHREEVFYWNAKTPNYSLQDYFNQYKWWLRREYRYQLKGKKWV